MLELKDIFHLLALAALVNRLVSEPDPGLVVVAGFGPRSLATDVPGGFLPSGRANTVRYVLGCGINSPPSGQSGVGSPGPGSGAHPQTVQAQGDLRLGG